MSSSWSDLLNLIVILIDFFEYKLIFLFFSILLFVYVLFILCVLIYYYYEAMHNNEDVFCTKKQFFYSFIILLLLILFTWIGYHYDINMYIELKNDNDIKRFHSIVKYAMLLWFIVSVMISIYLYIYDTIDTYLLFLILVYFLLTAFIIYLFVVQLYLINIYIRVEIDYKNYIAKKIREADAAKAAKALLAQEEFDSMVLNKAIISCGIVLWFIFTSAIDIYSEF